MPANPRELFKAGKVREACVVLTAHLREHPSDTASRTFLFELLCFSGEFTRAEKQLAVSGQRQPGPGDGRHRLLRGAACRTHAPRAFREGAISRRLAGMPSGRIEREALHRPSRRRSRHRCAAGGFCGGILRLAAFRACPERRHGTSATTPRYALGSGAGAGGSVVSRHGPGRSSDPRHLSVLVERRGRRGVAGQKDRVVGG